MYKLNIIFPAPMAELVDATDSKSVELRFMSVRVGLGVPLKLNVSKGFSENYCVKNSTGHHNLIRHRE